MDASLTVWFPWSCDHHFQWVRSPESNQLCPVDFLSMLSFGITRCACGSRRRQFVKSRFDDLWEETDHVIVEVTSRAYRQTCAQVGSFTIGPNVGRGFGLREQSIGEITVMMQRWVILLILTFAASASWAQDKPNILILFPDDVGWQNVSAYGLGTMGYRTPNIDRIAREGVLFTDHYAQPSCTAGRAALITGQYPIRSGMTTVGRPGAELGLKPQSHTLAEVLKPLGYATGQFGKNHLGDRNEHLPTMHGFDEFFGNLYHLNTQEEFEQLDYPKDPEYFKEFGTRGVLHTRATDKEDKTVDPRFGKVGKQTIEDTGQLGRERMKTFDQEVMERSLDFIRRAKEAEKPFFVWFNPSRMHMYTRLSDESRYLAAEHTTEHDVYGSGLIEHDQQIGELLDALEEMGLLDNTIVVYSTDNGPEHSARLHGGTTPFRGEKMTTYEGGVRVPMMVRWPGKIPAGTVLSGIQTHMDIYTTLAAAAGEPDIAEKVEKEYKQPIDGVNNLDYWMGKTDEDALGLSETHLFGQGVVRSENKSGCGMWEGLSKEFSFRDRCDSCGAFRFK